MSQTSDIDTSSQIDFTKTHEDPPNTTNTNKNQVTSDNFVSILNESLKLDSKDQHRLILNILDSQGELGYKFVKTLYEQLTAAEEKSTLTTNRKRKNTNLAVDDEMQISQEDTGSQAAAEEDPSYSQSSTANKRQHVVSIEKPTFPPRNQPPPQNNNNQQQSTSNNSKQNTHNFFPGATTQIKIPPITLVNPKTYQAINQLALQGEFKISHSKQERNDSIKIFPETTDDYRKITKILEQQNQEFICRDIDEAKLLKVVFRNVPKFVEIQDIEDELTQQGYEIVKIDRMYRKNQDGTKTPYSLVLIQLPHNERSKQIYNLKHINGFAIKVEPKRTQQIAVQCHNCQQFGHNQQSCRLNPKCHRCAGQHHYSKCEKPVTIPAKCCNCEGSHPANFTGCPKYPKHLNPIPRTPHSIIHPSPVQQGVSYSQATTGNINPLLTAIQQLQLALTAFISSPTQHLNV